MTSLLTFLFKLITAWQFWVGLPVGHFGWKFIVKVYTWLKTKASGIPL